MTVTQRVACLSAVLVAVGGGSASAAPGRLVDFSLALSSRIPATASGMDVGVLFHTAGDPDRKSSPVRRVVIAAPAGTRVDSSAMPRCRASDAELRALGSNACPAGTEAGLGTYSAILGFGEPVDPFVGDNHVFNGERQLIEVVTFEGTAVSPGFDRLSIEGNTLTARPPVTPGGPPDGETATRSIAFRIPVRVSASGSLITTPAACPPSGYWESTGTFGFANGQIETVASRTPCEATSTAPAVARSNRPRGRCLKSGRGRLTLRVPRASGDPNEHVRLLIDGRLARHVSPSARRVRVSLRERAPHRHHVRVLAVTASGRYLSRHRAVRTCP